MWHETVGGPPTGKFLERASDEILRAYAVAIGAGDEKSAEARALRLFWRLFFPVVLLFAALLSPCSFFEKCRYYRRFRAIGHQIPCSLQGSGEQDRSMQVAVVFLQIGRL